ncbi:hypothetical protein [Methylobacterium flocculans]|uniref:hypothetical protein n=1 Tax=Methylobacterium flocculans TaxID=2984843 RepID=UPI0021F33B92|nr:hypothetical protein [Methylobacterium sp. FF17]
MNTEPRPVNIWTPGQGDPVPRHKRNPRRAYDPEGREIAPATIANSKANGAGGLMVLCKCGRETTIPFDGLPDTALVPDVALRLRCSACGSGAKDIETRPDFTGRATSGTGI